LKSFLERSGRVQVVPIRYDLCNDLHNLKRSLDSCEGVLYTGGFLQIRTKSQMPTACRWYYETATEVLKYCMENKMPLLAICQGFQIIPQIIVDLYEPKLTDEEAAAEENKDNNNKIRDGLLSDLKMFGQMRTTKWVVPNPGEFSGFLKAIPKEILDEMETGKMIRHAHNWAITTDYWNSCKSLVDFFNIIGVDDGLPQGYAQNEGLNFKEFPTIFEAKDYPIHAWLTHPEAPFSCGFLEAPKDKIIEDDPSILLDKGVQYQITPFGDPPTESQKTLANTLSDSFVDLCEAFSKTRYRLNLQPDLHMEIKPEDFMMRNMAATAPRPFYMKAWAVTSLKRLQE